MKKLIITLIIITLIILACYIENKDSSTTQDSIKEAQMQAEINKASK